MPKLPMMNTSLTGADLAAKQCEILDELAELAGKYWKVRPRYLEIRGRIEELVASGQDFGLSPYVLTDATRGGPENKAVVSAHTGYRLAGRTAPRKPAGRKTSNKK